MKLLRYVGVCITVTLLFMFAAPLFLAEIYVLVWNALEE